MQVIEPPLEVLRVPEAVSLPFECLDFVDKALDGPAGDAMLEVIVQSGSVGAKGPPDPFECLDPRVHCIAAPDGEKLLRLFAVVQFPEKPQLLFHRMDLKKRLVDFEQRIEPGFPIWLQ